MPGRKNEVRDPVHTFIEFDGVEREVIDSPPFQRLRHIHQLALSGQVYPGASHKRFEHSLGVMHLASRIFDVVTREEKLSDAVRDVVPARDGSEYGYWRTVLRIAALCHDIGHLPFSHAAERELLPDGWDHERVTYELIGSDAMAAVWESVRPSPKPADVAKLVLGRGRVESLGLKLSFSPWEAILAEMITSDALGADRMDYLLRDSLHTGVAYGRFDHNRLIQTMRILPPPPEQGSGDGTDVGEPQLGIERGGLESVEALLLARYFMFAQVYYHPTRLIYDEHLKDFLGAWLPGGQFPVEADGHLTYTDNEIWAAITTAAGNPALPGHDPARRITKRDHFRVVDERKAGDVGERSIAAGAVFDALKGRFTPEQVRFGRSPNRGEPPDFPVLERSGEVASSLSLSEILGQLPVARDEYVFMPVEHRDEARRWLDRERENIIETAVEQRRESEVDEKEGES
jgi:HD superfamily phosphohydrolase